MIVMKSIDLVRKIQEYAKLQYPNEMCGFVVKGEFIPVQNISSNPTKEFSVADEDFLKYRPVCSLFVHSHPDWYNCPSKSDMEQQQATKIAWGIVSTDGNYTSAIQIFGDAAPMPSLMERTFCHGVTDCWNLIRDWYRINKNIVFPDFPRSWEWWEGVDDLYTENFAKYGFTIIPQVAIDKTGPEIGDIFLARIRSSKINHAGVYLGKGLGLHHLASTSKPIDATRMPSQEPLERWRKYIHLWIRHSNA